MNVNGGSENRKGRSSLFVVGMVALVALTAVMLLIFGFRTGDNRLQQADESYRQGESAKTIAERKEAFNHTLDLLLQVENEYRPEFGNGHLYYTIGNTYFQLEQYPWAILYYLRAHNLMPRNEVVPSNLALARNKLSLTKPQEENLLDLLLFHPLISLPERLQLFFCVGLATLIFCFIWIWTKKRWCWNGAVLGGIVSAVLLVSLGISHYLSPVEAVLVNAVELRRDAGNSFAKVSEQPVPAGSVVEVVGTSADGAWLKVVVDGTDFGYVPQGSIRLIRM